MHRQGRAQLRGQRALLGIGIERGVDRLRHLLRQLRAHGPERGDRLADRAGGGGGALAEQRVLAAEALVEGEGKGVDVGGGPGPSPSACSGAM